MSTGIPDEGSAIAGVDAKKGYSRFLVFVAGLGGLLYGVDVGIIGGALPYLEATSGLNVGELSIIVAAVLLGSVISTLFAGLLADWIGRKPLMILSGSAFVLSIPIIALSHGYEPLFFGRLLQGISGGLIGLVVPLYLAECLMASNRGKGTGVFQWLLTLGIVTAAVIGIYYSYRVAAVVRTGSPAAIFAYKDQAWRRIFWVSLPPGILFVLGSFFVAESPRWLFRRGRREAARAALLRSRSREQTEIEMHEMETAAAAASSQAPAGNKVADSLLRRKYVIPFVLACVILACNQATGINSIIGYNTNILLQSGLSDLQAHWGYVIFTSINFLFTIGGVMLVDRKGRKFLFKIGTAGICLSLLAVGMLFLGTEELSVDCRDAIQALIKPDQTLALRFDQSEARSLLAAHRDVGPGINAGRASLTVIYSYGDFTAATTVLRSNAPPPAPIAITRESCVPNNRIQAFFQNPFADLDAARNAPLTIDRAVVSSVPEPGHGYRVALALFVFVAFYSVGRRVRMAGAFGVDAHAHTLQWHEHRARPQSDGFHRRGSHFPAGGQQTRVLDDFLRVRHLHPDLLRHRRFLPAGNQRQNARRDRTIFRGRRQEGQGPIRLPHPPGFFR